LAANSIPRLASSRKYSKYFFAHLTKSTAEITDRVMKSAAPAHKIILFLTALSLLAGCASRQSGIDIYPYAGHRLQDKLWVTQALYAQFQEWQAVPYQSGGLSKLGIDCSGFVYLTYLTKLGIKLPRSSDEQMRTGQTIAAEQLRSGDLVFFITGRNSQHVGIYLEDRHFLHVSEIKGVTISSLDDRYWAQKYWKAQRVLS
jgi:probable lipoprotein NlpC